ncbi:hypothetical protein MN608_07774 [Microdochium nivale]|nr:hypothetical protein MN608_07774 [Microdochium nivale]
MPPLAPSTPVHRTVDGAEPRSLPQIRYVVIGLAFSALLFLVRRVTSKTRRRTISQDLDPDLVAEAVRQQQLWAAEKSRGVSRIEHFMSADQATQDHQLMEDDDCWELRSTGKNKEDDFEPCRSEDWKRNSPASGSPSWTMQNRPRPPPPLTPPVLDVSSVGFEDLPSRPGVPKIDDNFFGLPNPDYMSATMDSAAVSESTSTAFSHQQIPSATPRRRSYTKVMHIGGEESALNAADDSAISLRHHQTSSSPAFHGTPESRDMNIQGEIISVLDNDGAGWKRHTRVYGGGVCLACLESEGKEGGGFYGENVRPEDRRH